MRISYGITIGLLIFSASAFAGKGIDRSAILNDPPGNDDYYSAFAAQEASAQKRQSETGEYLAKQLHIPGASHSVANYGLQVGEYICVYSSLVGQVWTCTDHSRRVVQVRPQPQPKIPSSNTRSTKLKCWPVSSWQQDMCKFY